MLDIQPPLECSFCESNLRTTPHKLTCRIVTDIEGIEGWLDLPPFLDRRRKSAPTADVFS